jgi:hypothetical protein
VALDKIPMDEVTKRFWKEKSHHDLKYSRKIYLFKSPSNWTWLALYIKKLDMNFYI